MAWGQAKGNAGLTDLAQRLSRQDPSLQALCVMRLRQVGEQEISTLCNALSSNTVLTDLDLSQHAISPASAHALATMLCQNATLQTIRQGHHRFLQAKRAHFVLYCPVLCAA
jgi:hypothetical protein